MRQKCLKSPRLSEIDYAAFKKEIGAIEIHGLEGYFLDIIRQGIQVTNTPNSVVAFLLGITDDKPNGSVKYKGGSLPDIDIDYAADSRDRVFEYLRHKYGNELVANIGTYNKMYAKSAIRFVGKALGYDYEFVDSIAKMIPDPVQGVNWTIEKAIEINGELKQKIDNDAKAKDLIKWAKKLEGLVSSKSKHAAGVIIADSPINDTVSTWRDGEQTILEFDMEEAESLGYVKADFLALKTLDIMRDTVALIKERSKIDIDIDTIPIHDDNIFKLLSSGNLLGVFQLEGRGISEYTKEFNPSKFMDIVLISAGYRPGPMVFMPNVAKIKKGHRDDLTIEPHAERFPILKPILEETYGYFIFQEQIQKTVELLAGYNDSEADEFRKIIAKKIREKMVKEKERFFPKAKEKGLTDEEVEQLWNEMESFAAYSFNKSHAVSYSIITARTAWLKYYYPVEFFTANILHELSDIKTVMDFILESKRFGISILPPDINESSDIFTVVNDKTIRYGFSGIVGVGITSNSFIENRKLHGPYKSVSDFILRTNVKSNVLLNMIKAGCFDSMINRSQLLHEVEPGLTYVDKLFEFIKYYSSKGYTISSADTELIEPPFIIEYPEEKLIELELETTNLWLTAHPKEIYRNAINKFFEKHKNAYVGFVVDHKVFKSGKGLVFTLETVNGDRKDFFVFQKLWNKISREDFSSKYYNRIIGILSQRGFKDEPNKLIADSIEIVGSQRADPSKRRAIIKLDHETPKHLEMLMTVRPQGGDYLVIKFVGKNGHAYGTPS